jgi:hypothetical protein
MGRFASYDLSRSHYTTNIKKYFITTISILLTKMPRYSHGIKRNPLKILFFILSARRGSNSQPPDSYSGAHPIELRAVESPERFELSTYSLENCRSSAELWGQNK